MTELFLEMKEFTKVVEEATVELRRIADAVEAINERERQKTL